MIWCQRSYCQRSTLISSKGRGKLFLQIYRDAKAGITTAYKLSKKNDPKFVHRNWMRSKETPGQIAEILQDVILTARPALDDSPA